MIETEPGRSQRASLERNPPLWYLGAATQHSTTRPTRKRAQQRGWCLAVLVHTWNLNTWEDKTGGPEAQGQLGLLAKQLHGNTLSHKKKWWQYLLLFEGTACSNFISILFSMSLFLPRLPNGTRIQTILFILILLTDYIKVTFFYNHAFSTYESFMLPYLYTLS